MAREQRLESFTIISHYIRHVKDGMISLGLGRKHKHKRGRSTGTCSTGGTAFCDGGGGKEGKGRFGIRCEG